MVTAVVKAVFIAIKFYYKLIDKIKIIGKFELTRKDVIAEPGWERISPFPN